MGTAANSNTVIKFKPAVTRSYLRGNEPKFKEKTALSSTYFLVRHEVTVNTTKMLRLENG
jgi:hypothetical protein